MTQRDSTELPKTLDGLPVLRNETDALVEMGREGAITTSFEELSDRVARLAQGLQSDADNTPDSEPEKIMLFSPASAAAITAALGILRAGKIVVPVDAQMSDGDLIRVLENCQPQRAFTTQRLAKRLEALDDLPTRPESYTLDDSSSEGEANSWETLMADSGGDAVEVDADAMAVLFYTSGTTGPPKGVPLSHRNLRTQLQAVQRSGLIAGNERVLLPLPLHHVYPFVIGMLAPMAMGIPIILPEALTGGALRRALRKGGVTVAIGVPRLYAALFNGVREKVRSIPAGGGLFEATLWLSARCLRAGFPLGRWLFRPLRRRTGSKLRLLASGGSPLDPELAADLEAFGWGVAVGYGLTETAPLLTLKKPGEEPPESVGRALESVELKLDDNAVHESDEGKANRSVKTDTPDGQGELLAKGSNVFEGYHRMAEKTEACFTEDGFFRTGDLARIVEGQVFIEGRISTRIALQGGENIDPAELEAIYAEVEGVEEIGVLEDEGKLAALVVPEDDLRKTNNADEASDRLKKDLKARGEELPSYQRLARVQLATRPLERTRLGKLRRHELEEAYADARKGEGEASGESPAEIDSLSSEDQALLEDGTARDVWDLLCERYPDRPVEPDAHLEIKLGIDSMEWVELSLSIESAVGVAVDEDLITRVDSVRDLLEAVTESAEGSADEDIEAPLENPLETMSEADLPWTEPRSWFQLAVCTLIYPLMRLALRGFFPIKVEGGQDLPEAPYILAPNHVSHLDAPTLSAALGYRRARRFFWAGDSGIMFGNSAMRTISRLAQVVPIDARRRPRSSLAFVALLLDRKRPLVWFPEGGISNDGELQNFLPGIGVLLKQRDVKVVPVHIEGTRESLPRGRVWPRRSHARVRFGEPCAAESLRDEDGEPREPKAIAAALREKVAVLAEMS